MRLQRRIFDSRVARRIFGLFFFASFVPLLVLALTLLGRVSTALESEAFAQLESTARGYGQLTIDRLLFAAKWLQRGEPSGTSEATTPQGVGVDAVVSVTAGARKNLLGNWQPPRDAVAPHEGLATVAVVDGGGQAEVILAARQGQHEIYGRVDPSYLSGPNALLGAEMEACVFVAAGRPRPIHCSAPLPSVATEALAAARERAPSGRLQWSSDGEEYLAAYWELFLPSRFDAEPWTIVVSQPRSTALASLAVFNRVVPQAAVLTLALIVILAVTQIRRTLTPLSALLAATKRIAGQDFSTPVQIDHRDEFGALGSALNGMADQLEHQFGALRALADIDRSILETTAIEPVLETLFRRLDTLLPGGRYAVLVVDSDNDDYGRIYRHERGHNMQIERTKISPELRRSLIAASPERTTDSASLGRLGFIMDRRHGDGSLHVAPMHAGEALAGALVIASRSGSALPAPEITSMRELAARVAVAIAAGKHQAELLRRAQFDPLTNLPNRELFDDRLQQAVARAQREERPLAVLFIDLDGFKEVNDTLGHRSGDELLKEAALRLTASVGETDTVARLSGDEYAAVLPRIDGALEAEAVAAKAIDALSKPFVVDGRETYVSASIGLALFPEDGTTASELLRKADMAMYAAKETGKGRFRFFAEEMDRRLQERHSLHHDLRYALELGEFAVAYQPQLDIRTGQFVAAEALLRWRHPTRGPVSPALFVPLLEETGLIVDVGAWTLRKALADFGTWRSARLSFERVAVNVSARQLFDPGFVDMVAAALASASLTGHQLEVELTEASLVQDFGTANNALLRLRSLGVRIALDDFGTGYSSLAYLNELVFDTLKIDRAFVVNLPTEKSIAIVKAIIAVASSLGKEVVAEGIESQLQLTQLADLGCHYGQGYLLGRPLPSPELMVMSVNKRHAAEDTGREPQRRATAVGE